VLAHHFTTQINNEDGLLASEAPSLRRLVLMNIADDEPSFAEQSYTGCCCCCCC
jgi:hypothetical protein